ncbi:uncharacterized protein DUF4307 [Sediminihabitans luteus]|uniref:Uncharacterized protein DUF4307 n=1 Tax=Sediminihabitans luteus TaxID=1138585 RepID=A0A2M9CDJ8_9CELL|nr:DUF4307 domain-containing protein [Sediminihabitans luteus]PJJ69920.1 uncharacterized protein DUF4307 [Sediminihabitans luteus]GII99240.1 hypothetical protein Slu03_16180 [Sediminihabitans luteus]
MDRSTPDPETTDQHAPGAEAPAPALPAGRYGVAPGSRPGLRVGRRVVSWYAVAITVFCVLGTAVVAWIAVDNATGSVEWKGYGFEVVSPEQVDVTFDVTMEPGSVATCTIDAMNPSFAQVGSIDVTVGPNEARTARYTVSVATSEEATTGNVTVCDLAD